MFNQKLNMKLIEELVEEIRHSLFCEKFERADKQLELLKTYLQIK